MGSAAGGFPVAQLTSGHVRATGIGLPTRGRGYPRGPADGERREFQLKLLAGTPVQGRDSHLTRQVMVA
jgi:hypothetical protein